MEMRRLVALVTLAVQCLAFGGVTLGVAGTAVAGPFPPFARPSAAASAGEPPSDKAMVAVVKAPDADGACQEIVTRIVAELMADGVSVVALTCPTADPACVAGSGARVSAVVLVQVRDNVRAVEVHSSTPPSPPSAGRLVPAHAVSGGKWFQRVAEADTGGGPAALAVRTVEVLRAMLVDAADGQTAASAVDVAPAAATVRARPEPPARQIDDAVEERGRDLVAVGPVNLTMSVGVAMFAGFDGLNSAYGPALNIGRRTSDHVMLSLVLAGPAFGGDQSNAAGIVSVRHEMAALQADLMGLFWKRLVLRVGIAGGIYHVAINGRPHLDGGFNGGSVPRPGAPQDAATFAVGRDTGAFSGLLSWSAGIVANLRPDIGIFLDGRLFVLTPTPVVLLNGLEVGRVSNPQLAFAAGLEFRL